MFRLMIVLLFAALPFATQAQFWVKHTIHQFPYDLNWHIAVGDFNSDGYPDFVTASHETGSVRWWENTGAGTGAIQHAVGDVDPIARVVQAADIDNDGDDDILVPDYQDQCIWWENDDGTGQTWTEHAILQGQFWATNNTELVDMDQDGDIDIRGVRYFASGMAWWENAGDGLTWEEHPITENGSGSPRQFVADFDSDGDLDLFGVHPVGCTVTWYENLDGNGLVWNDPVELLYEPYLVDAAMGDLDNDGDVDLVTVDYILSENTELKVWENDGEQNLTEHIQGVNLPYPFCVDLIDLDVDGDLDFVFIYRQGGVYWWENRGDLTFVERGPIAPGVMPNYDCYAFADFDQDGRPDYLAANRTRHTLVWYQQMEQPGMLTLTRTSEPVVPANGGTVIYDGACESYQLYGYPDITFWTSILQPDGTTIEPAYSQTFNLPPFFTTTVTGMTQDIPSDAPAGDYSLTGHIGYYPESFVASSITFSKSATGLSGPAQYGWHTGGDFFPVDQDGSSPVPESFTVSAACPNPFNPTTSFTVQLPADANLNVTLHDITGRLVATLANETRSAGEHTFTFDGQGLASGVYFVRANSGAQSATRKLVLMK